MGMSPTTHLSMWATYRIYLAKDRSFVVTFQDTSIIIVTILLSPGVSKVDGNSTLHGLNMVV